MSLLGSKFAAKGASIAFHKDDHALAAVERRGMSLNTGTLNTISIDKYEVGNFLLSRLLPTYISGIRLGLFAKIKPFKSTYFLSKVDLTKLNKIFKWNPFKNESDWYDGFTCVNRNSSYHRWIQTMGFQTWSKLNCEYLFSASFLRACSIIRTNGVEYRREYDNETREINDASKYSSPFLSELDFSNSPV